MVFEVINDRGMRLRPHEILKGKLLGQINKVELDKGKYNELWEKQSFAINSYEPDELDEFIRFYLKSKFAVKPSDGQKFDGDYHRAMFMPEMEKYLGLSHSPARVKGFLKGEFNYFGQLYEKLLKAYEDSDTEYRNLYYCYLLRP